MTQIPSRDVLKAQAKRLRADMKINGTDLPHAAALEMVAHQWGMRDWNTLAAVASLQVTIYDMELQPLFIGRGGMEATDAIDSRSSTGRYIRRRNILENDSHVEEGIQLALHPTNQTFAVMGIIEPDIHCRSTIGRDHIRGRIAGIDGHNRQCRGVKMFSALIQLV